MTKLPFILRFQEFCVVPAGLGGGDGTQTVTNVRAEAVDTDRPRRKNEAFSYASLINDQSAILVRFVRFKCKARIRHLARFPVACRQRGPQRRRLFVGQLASVDGERLHAENFNRKGTQRTQSIYSFAPYFRNKSATSFRFSISRPRFRNFVSDNGVTPLLSLAFTSAPFFNSHSTA